MEDENKDTITAFDTLFTTDHIKMYKVLLPHLNKQLQQKISMYIKFAELKYTMSFWAKHPDTGIMPPASFSSCEEAPYPDSADSSPNSNPLLLLKKILPYTTPSEHEQIIQILNLTEQLKNMQDMLEMVRAMQEIMPGDGSDGGFNLDPEILMQFMNNN